MEHVNLRCQMFHKGCHGRAVSAFGSTTLKQTKPHDTHVASPAEAKTRQAITKAKRMAVASYGMPSKSILDAAKSELNEAEIQAFPKDEQIKKIITNARKPVRGLMSGKYKRFAYNTLSPLFPIEFWNCFNSVLDNHARTNNAIEGWHRVFNKKFAKRNLNLSHFIIKLKEEEHTTWQLALRHAANPADPLRNPRANKQINAERQISKLVTNYVEVEQENRQRLPFLRTLQFHLAKFYTPAADNNPENEGNDESQEEEQ
ncbi:hypothetical protein DdX_19947 [Ditylenchus destructor]|uniref:MULE transposase domain-containing protein n=1 Tax=Ditylenchus destructor TaxID=166010 RepID=A0AAD4QWZ7_9BILA|nr:hypothetical protein DdX_19947 [Ditylenchus destructor]